MITIADMSQQLHKLSQEFNKVTDTDDVATALGWAHHALKFAEGIVRNTEHDMSDSLAFEDSQKLMRMTNQLRDIKNELFDMQQEIMRKERKP